jgi:hypothetical protein
VAGGYVANSIAVAGRTLPENARTTTFGGDYVMTRAHYYRERGSGDYLALFPADVRKDEYGQRIFDGRATALAGLPVSVCSTGIGERFLKNCIRVCRRQVPRHWLAALVG